MIKHYLRIISIESTVAQKLQKKIMQPFDRCLTILLNYEYSLSSAVRRRPIQ